MLLESSMNAVFPIRSEPNESSKSGPNEPAKSGTVDSLGRCGPLGSLAQFPESTKSGTRGLGMRPFGVRGGEKKPAPVGDSRLHPSGLPRHRPVPFRLVPLAILSAYSPACTKRRALARRTGNGASKARFAGETHAKPATALHLEQNRARALRDERDLPVRRDIPLRSVQRAPHAGATISIPRAGPAKRAGDCDGPAKRAPSVQEPRGLGRSDGHIAVRAPNDGNLIRRIGNCPHAPGPIDPFLRFPAVFCGST